MKIAAKISFAVAALALVGAVQAYAQVSATVDTKGASALVSPSAMVELPEPTATVTPSAAAPTPVTATVSPSGASVGIAVPTPPAPVPAPPALAAPSASFGSLGDLSDKGRSTKVPDSVKGVINRLSSAQEGSLEDLNAAREAVAKLDVMIDIEKRLNDLEGLRQERKEKSSVSPVSASALLPKNVAPSNNASVVAPPVLPLSNSGSSSQASSSSMKSTAGVDVERIYGATGRYKASLRVDGKTSVVKEGDKVSDGSTVKSITNRNVVLVRDGKERSIAVKNVETLSNGH